MFCSPNLFSGIYFISNVWAFPADNNVMGDRCVKFAADTDLALKELLLELYPDVETNCELGKKVDSGSLNANYSKMVSERVGSDDHVLTNAEIYNFLIENRHEEKLIAKGWPVPFYLKGLPERFNELLQLPMLADFSLEMKRNAVRRFLAFDYFTSPITDPSDSSRDCKIEQTAQGSFENRCGECSEFAYKSIGVLRMLGLDEGLSPVHVMMYKESVEARDFDHVAYTFGDDENPRYFDQASSVGFTMAELHKNRPHAMAFKTDWAGLTCSYLGNTYGENEAGSEVGQRAMAQLLKLCPDLMDARHVKIHNLLRIGEYKEAMAAVEDAQKLSGAEVLKISYKVAQKGAEWLHLYTGAFTDFDNRNNLGDLRANFGVELSVMDGWLLGAESTMLNGEYSLFGKIGYGWAFYLFGLDKAEVISFNLRAGALESGDAAFGLGVEYNVDVYKNIGLYLGAGSDFNFKGGDFARSFFEGGIVLHFPFYE